MSTKTTRKPRPSKKAVANGKLPSDGEILTLAEAAKFLRVSEDGLKADAVNGKVPSRLVAGEWRFSKIGLLCWLAQTETESVAGECASPTKSSKDRLRALIGKWKDDPTVDEMIEEIYRQRKFYLVGGA